MSRWERLKKIWDCFYYGLLPSPFYEDNPHYECGYLVHLGVNMAYAWRLLTGREKEVAD